MSDDYQCSTWASEADYRRDLRRRRWGTFKGNVRMLGHSIFWRTLFFLRLGWPYHRLLCRMGWSREYQVGVCGYCGKQKGIGGHR